MVTLRLNKWMYPYGVKLDKGSNQRLVFVIQDNLSVVFGAAPDIFNCIAFGFDRFE